MTLGLFVSLSFVLFAASCQAAQPKTLAVSPGRQVGSVSLGMSRQVVWKHYGRPTVSTLLGLKKNPYQVDEWGTDGGTSWLSILSKHNRVIQIELRNIAFRSQDGLTDASLFGEIHKRHPAMKTHLISFPDDAVSIYYADDVEQGEAWTIGSNHLDSLTSRLLPELRPDKSIIHQKGKPVLPDAPGVWGSGTDNFSDIKTWFAGGRRLHQKK